MRATTLASKRAKALRRNMTMHEAMLWTKLRGDRLDGLHFRRQHPIGPYMLDFFCSNARLAVEIDGQSHSYDEAAIHDRRRTRWLASQGIRTLRISTASVSDRMPDVLRHIWQAARERSPS